MTQKNSHRFRSRILAAVLVASLPASLAAQGLPLGPVGMSQEARGIYIEAGVSAANRKAIMGRIGTAQQEMRKQFGQLHAVPQWHICATKTCDSRNGMKGRATTYGAFLIQITSKAVGDGKTYTHELVHAQMASALPLSLGATKRYPAWFDEGLATLIGRTNGYPAKPESCKKEAGKRLPETHAAFNKMSADIGSGPTYHRAACAVRGWLANHSVKEARARLAKGGSLP